ncbi:hypothetical protein C0995_013049, partial [Termitomyces sp. Mi166
MLSRLPASVLSSGRQKFTTSGESEPEVDFGDYSVILPEEPFIWGVSHIIPRNVPENIKRPPYAKPGYTDKGLHSFPERIALGGEAEVRLRDAANLARKVRDYAGTLVKVCTLFYTYHSEVHDGSSLVLLQIALTRLFTNLSSRILHILLPFYIKTFLGQYVPAHGIPDDRPLHDGDIINIDVTVYLNDYHGDTSQTFLVGNVDEQGRELVRLTNEALQAGINACGPGRPFRDIGKAIHELTR